MKVKKIILTILCILLITGCNSKEEKNIETKEDSFNELKYNVPTSFIKEESKGIEDLEKTFFGEDFESSIVFSNFKYTYENIDTSESNNSDICTLRFSFDTEFKDYDLERYANIFHKDETPIKETINGNEWIYYKEVSKNNNSLYSYYTKHNNNWYEINYDDLGEGTYCEEARKVIINSLNFN